MIELFHSCWRLLFPLGWFVASGFTSRLDYRRRCANCADAGVLRRFHVD